MTSPLNEPMTEARAREIVKFPIHNVLTREHAKGYLERVEQEKPMMSDLVHEKHLVCKEMVRERNEALEAADRIVSLILRDGLPGFTEKEMSATAIAIHKYRAARAAPPSDEVGG